MNKPILLCAYLLAASAFASATDAATATTDAAPTTVQEVIVTAEKRAENIQDVPITVSVVTSQQIAQHNLTTTSGLVDAIPALTITNDGVFQVRSLGTQGFGRSAEQSVSVEVDGVAMPRPQAYVLANSIFDLDHIEVLSGPQGTLFGKNADAGVINIVTNAPILGKFEAIGHADVGTHDIVNADGVLNLPLGDDAALRLVLHRDTYGHVVFNTIYNLWDYSADDGVRARLLWKPRDNLAVNLSFDYQDLSSNGVNGGADFAGVSLFTAVAPGPLATELATCGVVPGPNNNRACASSLYAAGASTGDTYGGKRGGGAIQIDWTFWRGLTVTSITALRQHVTGDFGVHADIAGDFGDSLPADDNILKRNLVPTYLRQFSEELRIASPAEDRFNYVVGGYYSDTATVDGVDQAGQLGLGAFLPPGQEFRRFETIWGHLVNYAAFGQADFKVTPQFILIAGGRVTHDNLSDFSFNQFPGSTTATPPNPLGNFIYTGNEGFFSVFPVNSCTVAGGDPGEVADGGVPAAAPNCPAGTSVNSPAKLSTTGYNWKAGAEYHIRPDLMVYATASHGYKGPFFNEAATFPIPASELVIQPENTTNFEIGLKSTLFNRLAVDVSLFDERSNNFQTTIFVIRAPPQVSNFIQGNAPYAVSRGVNVSVFGELMRDLSFNADILYDDAHFSPGFLVSCGALVTCPAISQLPYAPTWKATFGGEYRHNFTDQIQGYLQSDFTYSAKYPYSSTPATDGGASSGPRYLLGARGGIRVDKGRYGIAVFCRNCLDERYPVAEGPYLFGGATAQYLSIDSYRVVGVTLDVKY